MLDTLHRRMVLPFFEGVLKRRKTFRYLAELDESQWLHVDELAERQLVALRRLLQHASRNCPYYRTLWQRRDLVPERVRSLPCLYAWPITDRSDVQRFRREMRATCLASQLLSKSTGGSTGVPVHFDLDPESNERRTAASYRGYGWAGARAGTRQLYLWGNDTGPRSPFRHWKDAAYHRYLHRRLMLNSFDYRENRTEVFLRRMQSFRPTAVVAYTTPLYRLARCLQEQKQTPYRPRSIIVGAEKLYDFQRSVIEDVFQAPVFETYGSREFMLIAAECDRHEGLHVSAEHLIVEVLGDDGRPVAEGTEGDVVITDLFNYGMPLIRYRIGDRAIAGFRQCSCGRGLPLLQAVTGRAVDMLHTPDGRVISGEFFPHLIKDFTGVRQFQVVQPRLDRVELRVCPGPSWTKTERQRLIAEVSHALGNYVSVDVSEVADIPLTASGKHRVVVSRAFQVDAPHEVCRGVKSDS